MASARTSDHHPIPMQATRSGLVLTTFALPLSPSLFRLALGRDRSLWSRRGRPHCVVEKVCASTSHCSFASHSGSCNPRHFCDFFVPPTTGCNKDIVELCITEHSGGNNEKLIAALRHNA